MLLYSLKTLFVNPSSSYRAVVGNLSNVPYHVGKRQIRSRCGYFRRSVRPSGGNGSLYPRQFEVALECTEAAQATRFYAYGDCKFGCQSTVFPDRGSVHPQSETFVQHEDVKNLTRVFDKTALLVATTPTAQQDGKPGGAKVEQIRAMLTLLLFVHTDFSSALC